MIDQNEIAPKIPKFKVDSSGSEIKISEASFPSPFKIGLQYGSPARGTWTIAHSPMLIPESHEIYVCCACCLHGVVLSAAEVPGGDKRYSSVTVTNENILKGDLEKMMIDGVSDIIDELPNPPKCVLCFTSCVQHFLHIDLKLVYRTLKKRYPDIDFIDGYMTPTLQRKFSPDVLGRRQLMRAIHPKEKDRAVNLAVNYFPTDRNSELIAMLESGGFQIRDFADLHTYADYQELGASKANICFLPEAKPAVEDMGRRLDQQVIYAPYSFDLTEIKSLLDQTAEELEISKMDWNQTVNKTKQVIKQAQFVIGKTPIAIDYTSTPRPLSLARMLLNNGFNVYAVYTDSIGSEEKQDFCYLQQHYPELLLRSTTHYKMALLPRDDHKRKGGVLAIGQKAAYFTGTDHFVNLIENSGLYGFYGIRRLMEMMIEAFNEPKDVRNIIQVKAWGCRG